MRVFAVVAIAMLVTTIAAVMVLITVMMMVIVMLTAASLTVAVSVRTTLRRGFVLLATAPACEEVGAVLVPEVTGIHPKISSHNSHHPPEHQLVSITHHSGGSAFTAPAMRAGNGDYQ